MKRYILYHGDDYYPEPGGLGDFVDDFDNRKDCIQHLIQVSEINRKKLGYDLEDYWDSRWATILDTKTWEEEFIEQEEIFPLIEKYESKSKTTL